MDKEHMSCGRKPRIAVIGNSNSIMRDSFSEILKQNGDFILENMSIGATPNILLLDVLATTGDLDYDFIIVETAVIDTLQGVSGAYPPEIAFRNLRLFMETMSKCPWVSLIFLILPVRITLLEPSSYNAENMYLSVAREFGVPVLNLYSLFRQMIGSYHNDCIDRLSARAPVVAEQFGFPRHLAYALSWSVLRKQHLPSNSFAISGFADHAHISRPVHRLVGNLLTSWILKEALQDRIPSTNLDPGSFQAVAPIVDGQEFTLVRQSSLLNRRLVFLQEGGRATYKCSDGYVAAGLFLNRGRTCSFIKLESTAGSIVLDCRFISHSHSWIGLIVPIIDLVGEGEITLTICAEADTTIPTRRLPDTRDEPCTVAFAEIAEIILITRSVDAAQEYKLQEAPTLMPHASIENVPWARAMCEQAYLETDSIIDGIGQVGFGFSKDLAASFMQLLREGSLGTSVRDRSRSLLLTGCAADALELLQKNIDVGNDDPVLHLMHQELSAFLATVDPP